MTESLGVKYRYMGPEPTQWKSQLYLTVGKVCVPLGSYEWAYIHLHVSKPTPGVSEEL